MRIRLRALDTANVTNTASVVAANPARNILAKLPHRFSNNSMFTKFSRTSLISAVTAGTLPEPSLNAAVSMFHFSIFPTTSFLFYVAQGSKCFLGFHVSCSNVCRLRRLRCGGHENKKRFHSHHTASAARLFPLPMTASAPFSPRSPKPGGLVAGRWERITPDIGTWR